MTNFLQIALNHGRTISFKIKLPLLCPLKTSTLCNTPPNTYARHVLSSSNARYTDKNFCNRAYDINTNVTKDTILFKYENPRFYKILNIFGISQFAFWMYLTHFAFTTLRDAPVVQEPGKELSWYERINLGENKYRNGITAMSFVIGYGILCIVWTFTLRSVRFLILRKGGQEVSLVTYTPLGYNRILTVPLKHISAQQPRETASVQLPLKVRNKMLFYVLDMRGEFKNPRLYDYTAGLNRHF